ncbi:MAG: hypothetical protein ACR2O4_12100 [Hyphomicrobiaceae bacterium]
MELEAFKVEMAGLLNEMDEDTKDVREVYAHLHRQLNEMRAMQMPVPDDLKRLEKQLEYEFCAQSQGR